MRPEKDAEGAAARQKRKEEKKNVFAVKNANHICRYVSVSIMFCVISLDGEGGYVCLQQQ